MTPPNPRIFPYGAAAVARAAAVIRGGGIVAVPTETVYGLAADARNGEAVARIYAAKGRPSFNPLIVHVADLAAAQAIAEFDARALALAEAFWPGPLTLVLPLKAGAGIAGIVTAGLDTVALRVPAHRAMQALLRASGAPLAAPSANASGGISPTRAEHVAASLGERVDLILDDGRTSAGVEVDDRRGRRDPAAGAGDGGAARAVRGRSPGAAPATGSPRRASLPAITRRRSRSGSTRPARMPTNG